eukprot:CAMPEP_0114511382 /NCGR_PEP_ID=MMETSP0109-20121206/14351_1 /TAXON_ID=29199 /ORGANISM="Chlorarachnion reptans, Strain CCCM449" /LENGTH=127 /DNA_ID=CAMNT_0001690873 /DNA_START=17 /DNA_END=397 /DNA_ORIENTATION=-
MASMCAPARRVKTAVKPRRENAQLDTVTDEKNSPGPNVQKERTLKALNDDTETKKSRDTILPNTEIRTKMKEEKTDLKEAKQETVIEESSPGPDVQEERTLKASNDDTKTKKYRDTILPSTEIRTKM